MQRLQKLKQAIASLTDMILALTRQELMEQKVTNPETKRKVKIKSLSPELQKKYTDKLRKDRGERKVVKRKRNKKYIFVPPGGSKPWKTKSGDPLSKPLWYAKNGKPYPIIYGKGVKRKGKQVDWYAMQENPLKKKYPNAPKDEVKPRYFYPSKTLKDHAKKKFMNNQKLGAKIESIRKGYLHDLNSKDSKTHALALSVALVDKCYMRVGNAVSSEKNDVRGLSNLQVKHVSFDSDNVIFNYKGKDGVIQTHKFRSPKLVGHLKRLIKGKSKNDNLLTYIDKDGNVKDLSPKRINDYFREEKGSPVTIHKLRTFHATRMAREETADLLKVIKGKGKSPKVIMDSINSIIEDVAWHMGHSPSMSKKHYIDPTVWQDFFREIDMDLPKSLAASVAISETKVEKERKPIEVDLDETAEPGEVEMMDWMGGIDDLGEGDEFDDDDPFEEKIKELSGRITALEKMLS